MISYGFTKELGLPFEKVREAVAEELKKEGFGILTEIDLQEKFREKLGVEFKRYYRERKIGSTLIRERHIAHAFPESIFQPVLGISAGCEESLGWYASSRFGCADGCGPPRWI